MRENGLLICQIGTIILTAVFGALTVIAENKGENKWSFKGKLALSAAVISAVIALLTQILQARSDREKTRVEAQKAQDDATKSKAILQSIERGIYPLFPPSVSVDATWVVPSSDSALQGYLSRIEGPMKVQMSRPIDVHGCAFRSAMGGECLEYQNTLTDVDNDRTIVQGLSFSKSSALFPRASETVPHAVLADFGVDLYFFAKSNRSSDFDDADLEFMAIANDEDQISFNPKEAQIELSAQKMHLSPDLFNSNGRITSISDLSGGRVYVTLRKAGVKVLDTLEGVPGASVAFGRIESSKQLHGLMLSLNGRRYGLSMRAVDDHAKYPTYVCHFPPAMEYRSDINLDCK